MCLTGADFTKLLRIEPRTTPSNALGRGFGPSARRSPEPGRRRTDPAKQLGQTIFGQELVPSSTGQTHHGPSIRASIRPHRALCDAERERRILYVLACPRFVDRATAEVDGARCSMKAITRGSGLGRCIENLAGDHGRSESISIGVEHPQYTKPELVATVSGYHDLVIASGHRRAWRRVSPSWPYFCPLRLACPTSSAARRSAGWSPTASELPRRPVLLSPRDLPQTGLASCWCSPCRPSAALRVRRASAPPETARKPRSVTVFRLSPPSRCFDDSLDSPNRSSPPACQVKT